MGLGKNRHCHHCTERIIGCHATCKHYHNDDAELKVRNAAIQKDKKERDFEIQEIIRLTKHQRRKSY